MTSFHLVLVLTFSSSTTSSNFSSHATGYTQGEGPMSSGDRRVYGTVNIYHKTHKLYSNIPEITCKVHILPVFPPCWPVNQVDYKKSTGSASRQELGKVNTTKHELFATNSIYTKEKQCLHTEINYTFCLLSYMPAVYPLAVEWPSWHGWYTGKSPQKGIWGMIWHLLARPTRQPPETSGRCKSPERSP